MPLKIKMNQKEKYRKGVVIIIIGRLLFFSCVHQDLVGIAVSWEHILPMPPQEQLCLRLKRPGGQFPVLRSVKFLILICLNEDSPKGIRAGQR